MKISRQRWSAQGCVLHLKWQCKLTSQLNLCRLSLLRHMSSWQCFEAN
jgi:hypothetical protein